MFFLVHSNSSEIFRFVMEKKKRTKNRKLRKRIKRIKQKRKKKLHSKFAHDLLMLVHVSAYYVCIRVLCLSSTFDCKHWCYNICSKPFINTTARSCDSTDLFDVDVDVIILVPNQTTSYVTHFTKPMAKILFRSNVVLTS